MYPGGVSATQVLTKLLLSVPLVVLLVLVWRSRLDLAEIGRGSVSDWLRRGVVLVDARDPNAIYQDGTLVGRVEGVEIDEGERVVRFEAVYETAPLEIGRPLAFRTYTIKPIAIEGHASGDVARPGRGIYQKVTCEILGAGRAARAG